MNKQYLFDGRYYNVKSVPAMGSESSRFEILHVAGDRMGWVVWDREQVIAEPSTKAYPRHSLPLVGCTTNEGIQWAIARLAHAFPPVPVPRKSRVHSMVKRKSEELTTSVKKLLAKRKSELLLISTQLGKVETDVELRSIIESLQRLEANVKLIDADGSTLQELLEKARLAEKWRVWP